MIRISSTTFGERAPVWNYFYFFSKFDWFIVKIIKKLQKFNLQSSLWDPKRAKKGPRRPPKELQIHTREPSRAPDGSKGRQGAPPGTSREPFRNLREHPGTFKNLCFRKRKP